MPSTTKKTTTAKKTAAVPSAHAPQPDSNPEDKYAANGWLSSGLGHMEDLEVPSGQMCLVKRPGLEGLIKAGVLRNMDSLTALVGDQHIKKGKKGKPSGQVNAETLAKDPKALETIMHTVDRVVCHCVVKPEVHMAPNDVTLRKPDRVYTDMIDIVDKMHIFNFVVGGTRDLETFRSGLDGAVGSLADGEDVEGPTE